MVPTKAYAMSAPSGPASLSVWPEPRKRPVPSVPAIYAMCAQGEHMAWWRERRKKRSKFGRASHSPCAAHRVECGIEDTDEARWDGVVRGGMGCGETVCRGTHSDHLDMPLLELALDAVEVGGIEVVALVGLLDDIVVDVALLERARLVLLPGVSHGHLRPRRLSRGGAVTME